LPEKVPRSFPHAMIDPVKVTAPIATPSQISSRCTTSAPTEAGGSLCSADEMPTSTAARPTKLWSSATSSGMPVIATRCAITAPMAPPTRTGTSTRPHAVGVNARGSASRKVAAMATTMPMIP
jgi:hypothetical protein